MIFIIFFNFFWNIN